RLTNLCRSLSMAPEVGAGYNWGPEAGPFLSISKAKIPNNTHKYRRSCEYVAEIQPQGDLPVVETSRANCSKGGPMKKFLIAVCSIVLAIGVSGCVGKAPVGKGKAPPPVVTRG